MRSFNVKVNGKTYHVEVDETGIPQAPSFVSPPVSMPAAVSAAPISIPADGTQVLSPLPGNIWHVEISEGAVVKKGQRIFALEAMKMEHDVLSPADGKIHLLVKKGDPVVTGAVLAVIT